ncbi:Ribosome biogenesis protein MAK21 [Candida viswanathii]|uniref:Ribosome biogenesis protein MAK21 n=1 Tax=Candida viswanathii TaxID=5486 RepID=A0A367XV98_9ASCO|nr:Ribosome biogenesis protein MAK21 [Candida viswanathii]
MSLNLSSLKDKISSKLNQQSDKKKNGSKKDKKKEDNEKDVKNDKKNDVSKKKMPKEDDEEEILRREALALGATEEDLKLLEGIESDDEKSEQEFDVDDEKLDKSFNSDLSKFMQGIGLGDGEAIVVNEDEEEEEEEVPDLVEEDEEEEDDQEESTEEEAPEEDDIQEDEEEEIEEEEESESDDSDSDSDSESEKKVLFKEVEVDNKKTKEAEPDKVTDLSSVSSSKLIVPNRTDWYNIVEVPAETPVKLDRFARERLLDRAKATVEKDNKTYLEEFASNTSQKKFLSQILSDGTLNDKISALTLLIQEAPLHNMRAMDTLLGYCDKKSRTAALQSIAALKDLLINGLLPDRKLFAFDKQPLTKEDSDLQVAVYYYEDYLKGVYFKLIQILEKLSHDPIVHVRMTVTNHIFDLLSAKPEQEVNLLKLGVNKLGDSDNKVAAKASYLILQLEQAHPAMKQIVTDAVIDVIFQSNNEGHAKYYGVTTLNQTILTRKEHELANSLVKTYFALFEKTLVESDGFNKETNKDKSIGETQKGRKNNRKNFKKGKKGGKSVKVEEKTEQEIIEEKNAKLFSALLTGLNRAFPFSQLPNDVFQSHLDTLFKITHSSNFNTSIQALVLVNHIVAEQGLNSDRYYRTLYESLLDPRLANSSKQGIYLNLLFKSLKNDINNKPRVLAFVKRMLQICSHWLNVGAVSGMLFLMMELSKTIPEVSDMLVDVASRPEEENDQEEQAAKEKAKEEEKEVADEEYDPRKRDPKFANAHKSSLWEIGQFVNHYHPTVSIYASSFIDGSEQAKPDLGLYTLSHFLDRFVYKNAKQKPQTKGSSIMQPLGGAHTGSLLVKSTNLLDTDIPVNTENWLNKKVGDIKPDEKFFHQYFTTKLNKIKSKKEAKEKDEDNEEDEEEDEGEIWEALTKSGVEDDLNDDLDDGFEDDLDMEDFMSDLDSDEGGEEDDGEDDDEDDEGAVFKDAEDFDEDEAVFQNASDFDEADLDLDDDDDEEEEEGPATKKRKWYKEI